MVFSYTFHLQCYNLLLLAEIWPLTANYLRLFPAYKNQST